LAFFASNLTSQSGFNLVLMGSTLWLGLLKLAAVFAGRVIVVETHLNANKSFMQGLILLGLIIFGIYLLYERGLMALLLEGDNSRISWGIIGIWLAMSARWLYLLLWVQQKNRDIGDLRGQPIDITETIMARWLNHGWFACDAVLKLGLLGTIIGFILMLAPIAAMQSFEPASLQAALGQMSGGMAVALYTTLTGLVSNLLLRVQFQFLADSMQHLLLRMSEQETL
jgi:hypothetical protein